MQFWIFRVFFYKNFSLPCAMGCKGYGVEQVCMEHVMVYSKFSFVLNFLNGKMSLEIPGKTENPSKFIVSSWIDSLFRYFTSRYGKLKIFFNTLITLTWNSYLKNFHSKQAIKWRFLLKLGNGLNCNYNAIWTENSWIKYGMKASSNCWYRESSSRYHGVVGQKGTREFSGV